MRIQKYLARSSSLSRRAVEALIGEQKVFCNGKIAQVGLQVKENDELDCNGQKFTVRFLENTKPKLLMMNKPLGIICSKKDDRGRKTIFELLPKKNSLKWVLIGRLDVNTSGLILFTDQGDFANQLMHPSSSLERVYRVRVFGENADSAAEKLCKGVTIEKQTLSFLRCERVSPAKDAVNNWFEVTVKTGQYRMVRRLWQSQGLRVSRLVRVSYAGICLPKSLAQGQTCLVDEQTVDRLKGLVGA